VRLIELLRSTTFRWALVTAGAFAAGNLLLFGGFYLRTTVYLQNNIDTAIVEAAHLLAASSREDMLESIDHRLRDDPRRVRLAALFGPDGKRLAGNVETLPAELPLDGKAHGTALMRIDVGGYEAQTARVAAVRLATGDVVVVGRDADELRQIADTVGRGVALELLPALVLALLVGGWLSLRAQRRIEVMQRQASRIVSGELQARLPIRHARDPLDRLAAIVNRMLDEIEELVGELAGVGDDIAHDIRTPLTRVRAMLERGRDGAATLGELQGVTDGAIAGLDQSLAVITALLRIAEIDHGRRLAGVELVRLAEIIRAVKELYEPIAEDKGVALEVVLEDADPVSGDRDLIFEAVANLVDNAVKFTPVGGLVRICLLQLNEGPAVRVVDTGPGINDNEREAVTHRFYRSDKSRGTIGVGLGLSLVAAIVKLHGFHLLISSGPGCVVEIVCSSGQHAQQGHLSVASTVQQEVGEGDRRSTVALFKPMCSFNSDAAIERE
jgi:signal transduction histidine kinase